MEGLFKKSPEWIVKQCEFMLHVGIDPGSSSGIKHARAQKLCPSADLSIVTNEQGYEHTAQRYRHRYRSVPVPVRTL